MAKTDSVKAAQQHLRNTGADAKDARRLAPRLAELWEQQLDSGNVHPNNPLKHDETPLTWLV